MKTTAKQFFQAWKSACESRATVLENEWDNASTYTKAILARNNSVTEDVAKKLKLGNYSEYYCMDSVLYKEGQDEARCTPEGETWLKTIRVAIENENQFNVNLYQEICHLMILNCELRVLVTYPGANSMKSAEMQMLRELISSSDDSEKLSNEEGLLVIFGRKPSETSPITWEGFVYKVSGWEPLK